MKVGVEVSEQKILGLTGGMCSGKDSWADLFEDEFGYVHRSTSNIVRDYIRDHNLGEPTRDLTRKTATNMRAAHGDDYLMREAIKAAGDSERVVISGIYVVPEALRLISVGGSIINIAAEDSLRFRRMSSRGRAGEAPDIEEYSRLTNNDLCALDTDQRLASVIDLADYHIDGEVSIHDRQRCRKMAQDVLRRINGGDFYV